MIKEVKDFKRKDLFENYNSRNNPFVIITTKIDITNVINYCKIHKNIYATMGYLISKVVNEIDAFKYRYKGGKIYYCDIVNPNFTQMYQDDMIGYFGFDYVDDYNEFINNFVKNQKDFFNKKKLDIENDIDEIWFSCVPWFKFTSLIPPFDKEITIPQFIWDKYELEGDKYYVNLMIMAHHGFVDGYHIGKLIENLNKSISEFN